MSHPNKDAWTAIAVGAVTFVLFVTLMGSMVLLGQAAGRRVLQVAGGDGVAGFEKRESVPVLCYHYLRGGVDPMRVVRVLGYVVLSLPLLDDAELWTQGVGTFEKQMRYLHENGYTSVTLAELDRWQSGRGTLPAKPVVITFDDADRSVYEYAYPVLAKYDMQATCFVVTSKVGRKWREVDNLSWDALREMQDSGVFRIESHTHDLHYKVETDEGVLPVFIAAARGLHDFGSDWRSVLRTDLMKSREEIARNLGWDARYVAWPYGGGSAETDAIAAEAGFVRACEMMGSSNQAWTEEDYTFEELFEIRRHAITARTSLKSFRRILHGRKTNDGPDPPTSTRIISGFRPSDSEG